MASYLLRALTAAYGASAIAASPSPPSLHLPNVKAAQDHAFALFNSIHSAMRQWGSSVHHNGMSFYLAQAPEGSVFYHGDYSPESPWSFDWLAFELEHAAIFAYSWEPRKHVNLSVDPQISPSTESMDDILLWHKMSHRLPPSIPGPEQLSHRTSFQQPLSGGAEEQDDEDDDNDDDKTPGPYMPDLNTTARGYLQIYRANRPLNLLYIDGESAAKCTLGPLDSQDLILRDGYDRNSSRDMWGEIQRGIDMCALAEEWSFAAGGKIDGFIRMEAGFEIIYCDFSPKGGLDLLSVQGSPFRNETGIDDPAEDITDTRAVSIADFEWLRASAARFHGHPAARLDVDWSSMVSAFAYPVNLTNPDWERQDLPRMVNATREERRNIRARLRDVVVERGGRTTTEKDVVNWQGVVDKIVTRFSKRLWWMANGGLAAGDLIAAIGTLIDPFTDYLDHSPVAEQLAIDRCAQHYVDPQLLRPETWTPEDRAVAAAVGLVSSTICTSLFSARGALRANDTATPETESRTDDEARAIIRRLIDDLRWSTWRECGSCALDEICSIPMFPIGDVEDYFHPTCKNATGVLHSKSYWGF